MCQRNNCLGQVKQVETYTEDRGQPPSKINSPETKGERVLKNWKESEEEREHRPFVLTNCLPKENKFSPIFMERKSFYNLE